MRKLSGRNPKGRKGRKGRNPKGTLAKKLDGKTNISLELKDKVR